MEYAWRKAIEYTAITVDSTQFTPISITAACWSSGGDKAKFNLRTPAELLAVEFLHQPVGCRIENKSPNVRKRCLKSSDKRNVWNVYSDYEAMKLV